MKLAAVLSVLLALAAPSRAPATTQMPDLAVVDGQKGSLYGDVPDVPYVSTSWVMKRNHGQPDPEVDAAWARLRPYRAGGSCSAAWRGYMATWEVREDKLWLVGLTFDPCNQRTPVPISALFPQAGQGVVADWVSGRLIVSIGPWTREVASFGHFDAYWQITVYKGDIVSRDRVDQPWSPDRLSALPRVPSSPAQTPR
jgi:hypothetical protein